MLALAGVAIANAQQVHRYGCVGQPWIGRADDASRRALHHSASLRTKKEEAPVEEVYFARGWAEQVLGDPREAVVWYGRATALPPRRDAAVRRAEQRRMKSFAQTNAGWLALNELGAPEQAEVLFRAALKHNPFNQMSHANLADLHRRRGDYDEALAAYRKALRLEPSYFRAMNEMALVYVEMARHERDPVSRATLLGKARDRHEHAVALVPADDEKDRARLRDAFDDALDPGRPRGRPSARAGVSPPSRRRRS
jgi:tetratricopeptide (TPR) repeat protein